MNGKAYTDSDYEFICKHFGYLSSKEIAAELGRTNKGVESVINRLRENRKFDYYRTLNMYWTEIKLETIYPRSGVRGITWNREINKWRVVFQKNRERYYLGSYTDLDEAQEVLKAFKEDLLGEED